ncbi:MAG: hypothetical protein U1E76_03880 [Planctomycetota bacterium]
MFIITDGILFAGFLAGYGFARFASDRPWPDPVQGLPPELHHADEAFTLITSSATMPACAMPFLRGHGDRRAAARFCWPGHARRRGVPRHAGDRVDPFIGEGARLDGNPWGIPFATYFFMMTGFRATCCSA